MAKTPLEQAKWYTERLSWAVLPLNWPVDGQCSCGNPQCGRSAGKHTLIDWKPYQTQRPTMEEIETWFTAWPEANIGVVTGALSGIVVVDVDPDHGGNVGIQDLIAEHGKLPDTPEVLTGGGGRHIYFRHPGVPIKNTVNLVPGVDIRADGGLVVVPSSVHKSGKRYEWEASSYPHRVPLAPLPDWLLQRLNKPARREWSGGTGQGTDWAKVVLHGAPEGARNDTCTRLTGMLFRSGLDSKTAGALVLLWNRSLSSPLPEDEVFRTLQSIASREADRRRGRAG